MIHARTRLIGLLATVAILLLIIGTPVILIAIGATPSVSDLTFDSIRATLTSPDDGTLALAVIGVVAWASWLVIAVSFAVEGVARVRSVSAPKLPGLGMPQLAAGRLIGVASLLFVALPLSAQTLLPPSAHSATTLQPISHSARLMTASAADPIRIDSPGPSANQHSPDPKTEPELSAINYTVRRGDSLWSIARDTLGDGSRYAEIVNLNSEILNGRPDFLTPGLVLRVPSLEPTATEDLANTYVVARGDTLSEIALHELGDAELYPEIAESSRDIVQPDGDRLRDPNLIRPGWHLTIPRPSDLPEESAEPKPTPSEVVTPPVVPAVPAQPEPSAESTSGSQKHSADEGSTAERDGADTDAGAPSWLLSGLTGAGALLAGALTLALRRHRRTQLRYRRPGQALSPLPATLSAVEKTAHVTGSPASSQVELLDRLLRGLVHATDHGGQAVPTVVTVELTEDEVILHLASDAELPPPWIGSARQWSASLMDDTPADRHAPYPLLVTVGQSDDGHLWMVNLEQLGTVAVVGDSAHTEAFGRYVAAELALNPWSTSVDVDTLGVAAELATLDPMRLHHHAADDVDFLRILTTDLIARTGIANEPEQFHAVLTSDEFRRSEPVQRVVKIIGTHAVRSGAAVIAVNAEPDSEDLVFELSAEGHLVAPTLGLGLTAVGLTADEATACASIVDLTRHSDLTDMPTNGSDAEGWQSLTDVAGALREELTDVRPSGLAGEGSSLPRAAGEYVVAGATTSEDVDALAPITPRATRRKVEESDPGLEDDLAAWFDVDCQLPRLTLLGSVTARTHGDAAAVVKRKPYYVELLTFLALHPQGVTSSEVADAFSISTARARTDAGVVRTWLGVNPSSGQRHLPTADASHAAEVRGTPIYQVEGLLVDLDLFRRARARGQSRGAEGLTDFDLALRLVSGQPFDQLRTAGWSWLLEGERLDHLMGCAIVDVAHIVTTHALAEGDLPRARVAVETARRAAPYDEISRLDLVAVLSAEGHQDVADKLLVDDVCNRSDDDLGPVDLPQRTQQIIRQRDWMGSRRPAKQ